MSSTKLLDFKRFGYLAAVFAILLSTTLPSLAFADQATDRSVQLSNTSVSTTDVTYKINFKSVGAAGAFVVDFCKNSPAIGATCTPPDGFDLTTPTPTSATAGFTTVAALGAHTLRVTGTIAAATAISVDVAHITNPSTAGPLYARILTYDTATNADDYVSNSVDVEAGGVVDYGGAAMSITPTIGVSGSVAETMTFCASASAFDSNGCAGVVTPPKVSLGTNGVLGNTVSDGTIYSQISTNAATGAVVNLKSSTVGCGGLMLAGATGAAACGIKPVITTAAPIADNAAKFGLRFGTVVNGTGTIDSDYGYSAGANYFMNYVTGDLTGVTSTYGDPIYDTHDLPTSKSIVPLIFGANIGDDTPAGTYSATLNLIATGKF